uniref:Uncharacterized protein n=1 Tax=Rhizophora mucronata TaxID=61149 RepID=A0A2P2QZK4_RHIMU
MLESVNFFLCNTAKKHQHLKKIVDHTMQRKDQHGPTISNSNENA